jgi:hypothetical protein
MILRLAVTIFIFSIFSSHLCSQAYLGLGITKSFSNNFNGEDINYSYSNADNLPMSRSWIEDGSYNFFTLLGGYKIVRNNSFHDLRITATNKGAISLLDKQDFLVDPIILDLQAFNVLGDGASRVVEIGVNNRVVGLRYGYGQKLNKFIEFGMFIQGDIVYKKRFTVNWYDNNSRGIFSLNTYSIDSFTQDENVAKKVSNVNVELGINLQVHLGKYFALNFEIAQSIIPSVRKGANPNIKNYVYWENNAYFTSGQISIITFFKKR